MQRILLLGSGGSGSTLLEMTLALSPEITALGEISEFARVLPAQHACTCGVLFADCPLWGSLLAEAARDGIAGPAFLARAVTRASELEGTPWCISSVKNEEALASERSVGLDGTRAVYLVRHPCGYVYSWVISGYELDAALATWIAEQERMLAFLEELDAKSIPACTVRYEELAKDPGATLAHIGAVIGVAGPFGEREAPWDWARAPWGRRQHVLCGAPWRLSGKPEAIREDERWRLALRPSAQAEILRACRPLLRRLGYADEP
ncbi:MAG TPA: hypothetical protein VH062_35190 [Polyangiaceae bacterium]|jgi:hypothetical protein|nr:hypothetical protein [Polyangiaceae bacterium]